MADLINDLKFFRSIAAQVATTTKNGTGVAVAGYNSAVAVFEFGAYTDGTFTPKLQESDDNSSFSDVAAADLIASPISAQAIAAVTAANKIQSIGYKGSKAYIRPVITVTGSPATGMAIAALVALGNPVNRPAA